VPPNAEAARTANLLGALSLVVGDGITAATSRAAGQSLSGAAALSALYQFLDRPTLDELGRVLGLTHSGAVRLVDRLVGDGLVTRSPGADGRSRSLALTAKGRRTARRIHQARAQVLLTLVDRLPEAQRDAAGPVLSAFLTAVVEGKDGGAWTCRLCDLGACQREEGRCPTAAAAAVKYAADAGT
jgi:DNA-binding MarR family transcriptional regulator